MKQQLEMQKLRVADMEKNMNETVEKRLAAILEGKETESPWMAGMGRRGAGQDGNDKGKEKDKQDKKGQEGRISIRPVS